jgi:hypothetical protein
LCSRHCEERSDEAIQRARSAQIKSAALIAGLIFFIGALASAQLDCFASLAMTWRYTAIAFSTAAAT